MTARDIMSRHVICLQPHEPAWKAVEIFKSHNFKSIPLLDASGRFQGVVWQKDLFNAADTNIPLQGLLSTVFMKLRESANHTEIVKKFFENPQCSIAFIVDEGERLVGLISQNDIFKLYIKGAIKRDEEELNENRLLKISAESYLREAIDSLQEGIVIVDRDTKVLFANRAYMRILGVQPHHVFNKKLSEIEPKAKIIDVLKTGTPVIEQTIEIESIRKTIVANITPIVAGGEVVGAISSFFDKTEFLAMARQLEKLNTINDYLEKELESTLALPPAFQPIVGNSRKLKDQLALAWRVAKTDSSVLIMGESGTGKELIARAIHDASKRKGQRFITINCSAIPENLIESELFGYEEGAFTDARKGGKKGKIELADEGTLFLDEVGDMPLFMQPRLLRFLQEKECERIGGEKTKRVNVRIIAATNKDLMEMVEKNQFRKDLFYRINTFTLSIPPLRERKVDILALIQHFCDHYNRKYGKETVLSNPCLELFLQYSWPGNVRELQHVIEHAIVLADDAVIGEDNLPKYFRKMSETCPNRPGMPDPIDRPFRRMEEIIRHVEKESILKALNLSDNNRTKAIELLGISRRCFYRKLKEYNLNTVE
jgi:transcriptional regulator with PAS, ATPase and Fis domain